MDGRRSTLVTLPMICSSRSINSPSDTVAPVPTLRIKNPGGADRRSGYPLALSRVILNLTTNAIKFTDEGSVEISARSSGPVSVRFAVRDTGRGIDPDALTGLYRPFRLGPGPSGYCFSGTGLGLAICRKLVEAMGSELRVETLPDSGTCFHFEVKLLPPDVSF